MQPIDIALATRKKRFLPYFEPIVDLHTGSIVAIEATVRLDRGQGTEPMCAVDTLRKAHGGEEQWLLDRETLGLALDAVKRLHREGVRLPVRVNVTHATCVAHREALAGVFKDPLASSLELELPASALQQDEVALRETADRLAELPVPIVIDHMDTLDEAACTPMPMPVKGLKMGTAFTASIGEDAAAERLGRLCRLSELRGWRVGVEGVVRLEQLERLRGLGCHEVQGPLLSPPRPLGMLMELLKRGRCW